MSKLLNVSLGIATQFFLKIALGIVLLKLIANNFGPSGLYAIANVQNAQQIIQAIIFSFFSTGVVTYAASHPNNVALKNTAAYLLQRILFCAVLILIAMLINNNNTYLIYLITIIGTTCSGIFSFNQSIRNGNQRYTEYNRMGIWFTGILGISSIFSVLAFDLDAVLLSVAILPMVVAMVVEVRIIRNEKNKDCTYLKFSDIFFLIAKKIDWNVLIYLSKYAWSSAVILCLSYGMQYIFRNELAAQLSTSTAGQWTASYKLSELYMGVINMVISMLILPLASEANVKAKKNVLNYAMLLTSLIGVALLGYGFSADFITKYILGDSFLGTTFLIRIQIFPDFLKIISWFFAFFMMAKGFIKTYLIIEVAGYLIAIIFGMKLVSSYGAIGLTYGLAAQATFLLAAYSVWFIKFK